MIAHEDRFEELTDRISLPAPRGIPATMVIEYVNRYVTSLSAVKTALEQSDDGYMKVFGHRLKGSGGVYGIPVLTEIGALIEEAAKRGDNAELRRQVAALEAYLGRLDILEG
jgi:HPt (histidine-containing phosphotransfer) domain-containing protein